MTLAAAFFLAGLAAFAAAWWGRRSDRNPRIRHPAELLALLGDHMPSLVAYVGPDLRYRWCNRTYAEWFGKTPSALRGRLVPEVVGAEAWSRIRPYAEAALRGETRSYVTEVRTHDDTLRWVEVVSIPQRGWRGRVVGVLVIGHDVSRRQEDAAALKRSERAMRRNADFQGLLVSLHDATRGERDPVIVMGEIVARVGRHFRVSRCAFCEVDGTGQYATVARDYVDGVETLAGRHYLADFGVEVVRDLRAGVTVAIADVRTDKRTEAVAATAPYVEHHIAAMVCVPLVKDARLAGILSLQHAQPREWSADEVALVEQVAERAWFAVDNARAQAALRESRDVLALAMRGGRMGAWSRDLKTNRVWWSRDLEEIFGLPPGGFVGHEQGFLALVHPEDRDALARAVDHATRAREDYAVEFRFRHPSGEWRWMEGRGRAVYDGLGQPMMLYGIGSDITERKRNDDALRDADRRKDEFLATLSHELRNPLAPIRNAVEILHRKGTLPPEIAAARDIIDRQARHMTRLVDDLLEASRITRGKVQLRMQAVPLAVVVHDAVEAARPLVERAHHELAVDLPEGVTVRADPTRLTQIVLNLLNNAAKYTPARGHIRLTARVHGDQLAIVVEDDGIGIPPDRLPHLFQMFSQVAPALERSQGGLGIGLALVRGLVEMHGGHVEGRSEGEGRGSRFIVRLPVVVPSEEEPAAPPAVAELAPQDPQRVLVVDDNRDAADSLIDLVRLMGHEACAAYDGLEAVELALSFRPQVVLLDIGLPLVNGYEAARRIREQPRGEEIALVAITGWGQDSDKRRALQVGFDHYLTKPVDLRQLGHVLRPVRTPVVAQPPAA